jgi:hypothetical protein
MIGFLVGYEPGDVYCVYHPTSKDFKITRDAIFSEGEFFDERRVTRSKLTDSTTDRVIVDEDDDSGKNVNNGLDDGPAPIIYDEIVVQPPPQPPTSPAINSSSKPPNRRSRCQCARAFKAMLKGNWKWPRNHQEAMEAEDAKQWELAMQKEYDSIVKNKTWSLVPRHKDAKVIKSHRVLRIKDNGIYKARFYAKGFTQQWGKDYDETFAPVAKYTSIRTLLAILAGHKA